MALSAIHASVARATARRAPAATARAASPALTAVPTLHDRKLRLMRARLAELALTPLLERGFDACTIDDLAAAAGIARRTFFRYFATKEDVVISTFDEAGDALLAELERRAEHEPPLRALRSTLDAVIVAFGSDRGRGRATLDLIRRTPTLRGRFLVTQDDWNEKLAASILARMPDDVRSPMRARLAARVAVAAIDTALVAWSERPDDDLRVIAAEAFDALGSVVEPTTPKRTRGVR
jgi:AcrR family transcriptional regulator